LYQHTEIFFICAEKPQSTEGWVAVLFAAYETNGLPGCASCAEVLTPTAPIRRPSWLARDIP